MERGTRIVIVDDDRRAASRVRDLASRLGLETAQSPSAEDCLRELDADRTTCIVIEFRLPGLSGLELQRQLKARKVLAPVVFLSAHATTHLIVQAMQRGALTVLDKACDDQELWEALCRAGRLDSERRRQANRQRDMEQRLRALTLRERLVAEHIAAGRRNREIAAELGIALRTVESCRQRALQKLQAQSVADIVRIMLVEARSPRLVDALEL
jgi:FixJ family two-component response regulator